MKKILLSVLFYSILQLPVQAGANPPVTWNGNCASGIFDLFTSACLVAGSSPPGPPSGPSSYTVLIPNNTSVGTVINQPAALLTSTGTVTKALNGAFTNNVLGIVTANAGNTGNATVAIAGKANCLFNTTALPGNYAGIDATTGKCSNAGTTPAAFSQVLGLIISSSGTTGLVDIAPFIPSISGVSAPLALNGSGNLQLPFTTGSVAFGNNIGALGKDTNNFFFDDTNFMLGVGNGVNPPLATVEALATSPSFSPAASSVSVSLTPAVIPGDVGSASATQAAPRLGSPTSPNAFQDDSTGSCGPANGSTYVYTFYDQDGTGKWNAVPSSLTLTDNNDSSSFRWVLNISAPSSGSAVDYYYCVSVNGGSLNCNDLGSSPGSFSDGCNSYSFNTPPSPQYVDFIANGTTYGFAAIGQFVSPSGANYYSVNPFTGFSLTDDNSGNAFSIQIASNLPSGAIANEIGNSGLSFQYGFTDGAGNLTAFGDGADPSWVGSPTSYGFVSNGTNLNNTFTINGSQQYLGRPFYSSTQNNSVTVDPNDGTQYYYTLGAPSGNSSYKIINTGAAVGAFNTNTNGVFDALSVWADGTNVLPTNYIAPAGAFVVNNAQSDPTNVAFIPNLILGNESSSGIETIQAQDSSGANHGYLQFSNSSIGIIPAGLTTPPLFVSTTGRTTASSNLNVNGNLLGLNQAAFGVSSIPGSITFYVKSLNASYKGLEIQGAVSQSVDYFDILNGSGGNVLSINSSGNATLGGSFTINEVTSPGHLISHQTTVPTATPNANLGTSGTCAVSHATDISGIVTLGIGTGLSIAAGAECAISFNQAYGVAPLCVISPTTSITALAGIAPYVSSTTAALTINFGAAGITATTYTYNYHCLETQ